MIRNWCPYTLGALCRGTGSAPLEPALTPQLTKYEVLMAVEMQSAVFFDVILCSLIDVNDL
jgi:hypothetical protein